MKKVEIIEKLNIITNGNDEADIELWYRGQRLDIFQFVLTPDNTYAITFKKYKKPNLFTRKKANAK